MFAYAYNFLQRQDHGPTPFERLLRRDRAIVGIALVILILLAWLHVGRLTDGVALKADKCAEFACVFLMWAAMMVAMMLPSAGPMVLRLLPSAGPMVLRYARIGRATAFDTNPIGPTGWFAAGYLLVWLGFAFAATDVQWALERTGLLTPMGSTSNAVGGILLIIAGLYQWSPLKDICLAHCQDTPLFLKCHGGFRRDVLGALKLGVWHGTLCVGCCWVLMMLLFVGGVMNVFSMAVIATLVLAEKIVRGHFLSRTVGAGLIVGGWLLMLPTSAVGHVHTVAAALTRLYA
jgi:predicted metal-binding membrane protein